jgi:phosphate transport system ATP-binding protein
VREKVDRLSDKAAISVKNVSCAYGAALAIRNANLSIPANSIYAFIGPSGCGKTTLLRSINRLNDLIASFRLTGSIEIDGVDIYADHSAEYVKSLRKDAGMIFQQANPLPAGILKNMYMPLKEHCAAKSSYFYDKAVEKLKAAALYDEIKDRLKASALSLSGGQQQRLCIARALMLEPKILLFDEPCSALDPIATYKIEDLLIELKKECTIVIVTHNMEQARRVSDYTAFFYEGEIVEAGKTAELFFRPRTELLDTYIRGKF